MTQRKVRKHWKPLFLDTLRITGSVKIAASNADVARQVAYRARESSAKFRADWDEALEEARELLEAEARRRAEIGVEEPVFYKGKVVGHIRKYSDGLLKFLLQAHWPEKFRENVSIDQRVSGRDGGPVKVESKGEYVHQLPDPETWAEIIRIREAVSVEEAPLENDDGSVIDV